MQILKRLWTVLSGEVYEKYSGDATAESLKRTLKSCPVCNSGFSDHYYTLIATTIYSQENGPRVKEFVEAVDGSSWHDLLNSQDWHPLNDCFEAYAIRCNSGQIAVITILSPYELFENSIVISQQTLSPESTLELLLSINDSKWKALQPAEIRN
jgi:hypothetical protein